MAKRWSPEEDELLIHYRAEGFTAREIAVRLKRSEDAVRVRLAAKAKMRERWSPEEETRLLELKQLGLINRKIAFELGRTTRAIEAKLNELMV
jgi:DNA-binding NarL/FixJ family response regulator